MNQFALIGGTGLEALSLTDFRFETVDTPYGEVNVDIGRLGEQSIVFMSRHGKGHTVPPHRVNYRANIWALKELGVRKIIATAAVGSLSSRFKLGDIVLLDQFLDFTKNRPQTFYEDGNQGVLHVDMTEPYCKWLQSVILKAAQTSASPTSIKEGAAYVCTEGPRFETPAEIRMFQILGGELVGMTSVPEVVLARELGMCYASIGMVTNEAAGIADHPLTHAEVIESMKATGETVAQLIKETFRIIRPEQDCRCHLGNAEVGKF